MSQLGRVTPSEGLRLRAGPGTDHDILGTFTMGEEITLLERVGDWWRVESTRGAGFVHGDFIEVIPEPAGGGTVTSPEELYTCVEGDTLSGIAAKVGVNFLEIARLNGLVEPFVLQIGQVLRLRAGIDTGGTAVVTGTATGTAVAIGTIVVQNPVDSPNETVVTSSSLQGHHRPFGGTSSCDLAVLGGNSQHAVARFNVAAPQGQEVRGRVTEVGLACRSGMLADGGRTVKLEIQRRVSGGEWARSGAWVLYAHLDPVTVTVGQEVLPTAAIGRLGPASGPQYDSPCARGSHIHVEAFGASCVVNEGERLRIHPVIELDG